MHQRNLCRNETSFKASLFPKEIIEFTAESYIDRIRIRSQVIYTMIVSVVILVLTAMPFIHVPVSIQSKGLIRSKQGNTIVASAVSGKIAQIYFEENDVAVKGEPIARIESPQLYIKENLLKDMLVSLEQEKSDLEELVNGDLSNGLEGFTFKTNLYHSEYIQARRANIELTEQVTYYDDQVKVSRSLRELGIVAAVELQKLERERERKLNSLIIASEEKRTKWETKLLAAKRQIDKINNELKQLESEKELFIIISPTDGIVQQIENLSIGSFVSAGQTLATVSPRDYLMAEIFVSTKDVGLIGYETSVVLQIDAFNHLDWGQVEAKISDISKDVYLVNGIPMFRIMCEMGIKSLRLKNGAIGNLNKGLTFTARFEIAERTLFQLLRDQLDDWFSPYRSKEPTSRV